MNWSKMVMVILDVSDVWAEMFKAATASIKIVQSVGTKKAGYRKKVIKSFSLSMLYETRH